MLAVGESIKAAAVARIGLSKDAADRRMAGRGLRRQVVADEQGRAGAAMGENEVRIQLQGRARRRLGLQRNQTRR